jgi:hypothetical protein
MDAEGRKLLARVDAARNFPENTCPASRHLAFIGEQLLRKKPSPMLREEPEHCAVSMLATVTALWEARTRIVELERQLGARDGR